MMSCKMMMVAALRMSLSIRIQQRLPCCWESPGKGSRKTGSSRNAVRNAGRK